MSGAALLCALCFAVSAAADGAPAAASAASWPDALHGWARPGGDVRCNADICATEDGGATWHGIFSGDVDSFVRTSERAGALSLADGRVYWTRDGARHWYSTQRIFGRFAGAGTQLFATSGSDLYRVAPWPPRGRTRCRAWRVVARDARAHVSTVCAGADVEAGMTDRLVATVHATTIGDMTSVPGGVFGVASFDADYSRLDAFVWRHGRMTETALPFPHAAWWCCATIDVAWPTLYVGASLYAPPGSAATSTPFLWRSPDGGATWTTFSG